MNCRETNDLLVDYLNKEVTPSQSRMVQAHLSECAACRRDLDALSALEDRVRRSLHGQAAQAVPSPEAWPRLQAALAGKNRSVVQSIQSLFTGGTLMRKLVLSSLLALALVFGVVIAVPSVRAQVREMIDMWYHFRFPERQSSVGVGWGGDSEAFPPYMPTYLPNGLDIALSGGSTAPGAEYWEFEFHPTPRRKGDDRFIRLIEGVGENVPGLPEGREVMVGDQPAVWTSDLEPRHEVTSDPPTPASAQVLSWYIGEVKIELVSNLPESEMIAVAESFVLMQEGRGDLPR